MMIKLPELSTNSFWSTQYKPSVTSIINSSDPKFSQLDNSFRSLKLLSRMSVQNLQSQQQQYRQNVVDFTSSVSSVNSSAKALATPNFFDRKYVSASSDAVTGEAKTGAKTAQYSVSISQVATTQRNEGTSLAGSAYGEVATGISTLGIQVGSGSERQFSVNVLSTDTNKQVLNKFASAINNSGAGIKAEVKTKNNFQYLSLESKETGGANSFTVRDISGNAGAALQLGNMVQSAADAQYTVNGAAYQSSTNKVSLDSGNVSLNLNKITTGVIKVEVDQDDSKIVNEAKALVTSYNSLHDILSNSDNITQKGSKVLDSVESLVGKRRAGEFAAIGISLEKYTGDLRLDEKKLSAALASNPEKVKNLFAGVGGLGKTVERISKELSSNPVNNYLKSPSTMDALNYTAQITGNSWMMQQNNLFQGLFVNMMV